MSTPKYGTTGQDLSCINIGDQYGYGGSLSDNGYHVMIGTNVGGVGDGLVHVYEYINGFWIN